jgi:biopolymer transport protein ExbD
MMNRLVTPSKPPALMLTPLLDMFTIVLIFLIVSFEAEDFGFKIDPDLTLPESSSTAQLKPAVNVSVNGDRVLVQEKEVVRLDDGEPDPEHLQQGQIPSLVEALRKEFTTRYGPDGVLGASVGEGEEAGENEPIVLLQADQKLNYRTVYLILRSAAQAGFFKYRLAIIKS